MMYDNCENIEMSNKTIHLMWHTQINRKKEMYKDVHADIAKITRGQTAANVG